MYRVLGQIKTQLAYLRKPRNGFTVAKFTGWLVTSLTTRSHCEYRFFVFFFQSDPQILETFFKLISTNYHFLARHFVTVRLFSTRIFFSETDAKF